MTRKRWLMIPTILVAALAVNGAIPPIPPTTPRVPAEEKVIRITEVRPWKVFPGDFATAYGFNLEAAHVKELWLVDGNATFRLQILEQGEHTILFRLPNWVPAGRWQLAVVTDNEMMIAQGVYLTVRPIHGWPTG